MPVSAEMNLQHVLVLELLGCTLSLLPEACAHVVGVGEQLVLALWVRVEWLASYLILDAAVVKTGKTKKEIEPLTRALIKKFNEEYVPAGS